MGVMMKRRSYIIHLSIVLAGFLLMISLGACKKNSDKAANFPGGNPNINPDVSNVTQGDFAITSLEPSEGKSGTRFVITGETLDPETDLILFGKEILVPISEGKNGRQFFVPPTSLQSAKVESRLSGIVKEGFCDQGYIVFVIRGNLRSNGLTFTVEGERPCPDPKKEEEATPENPDDTTTGRTVTAGDADREDDWQAGSVTVEAVLSASRTTVFRQISPQTTLTWSVSQGAVDAVILLGNGVSLQNSLPLEGRLVVEPLQTTLYQAVFTYRGEVVATKEVRVVVVGEDNDMSLNPYLDVEIVLPEGGVKRDWDNDFVPPPVTIRYVANRLQGIRFTFPELCVGPCPVPGERTFTELNHSFSFLPEKSGVVRAVARTDEGGEIVVERPITVMIDRGQAQMRLIDWRASEDPDLPGMAKIIVKLKNVKHALLIGEEEPFVPCLPSESDPPCQPVELIRDRPMHAIPVDALTVGSQGWAIYEIYHPQSCGSGASSRCVFELRAVAYDGTALEPVIVSVESLTATPYLSAEINSSDWTQMHIVWNCHYCREVRVETRCRDQLTSWDQPSGSEMQPICSNRSRDNRVVLKYKSYFTDTWLLQVKNVTVMRPSIKMTNLRPEISNNEGRYHVEVESCGVNNYALFAKTPEGRTCDHVLGVLGEGDHHIRSEDGQACVTKRFTQFPVHEDCHVFEVVAWDLAFQLIPKKALTTTPKLSLNFAFGGYNWHARVRVNRPGQDWCSATDYRVWMNVNIKNGEGEPWTEGRRDFSCPNIEMDSTDIGNLWHEWEEPTYSHSDRYMATRVIYHYYYKPERAYGCRLCTKNKNGITFCTPFNADFPNTTPVGEGSQECKGKGLKGYPVLREEDTPEDMIDLLAAGGGMIDLGETQDEYGEHQGGMAPVGQAVSPGL